MTAVVGPLSLPAQAETDAKSKARVAAEAAAAAIELDERLQTIGGDVLAEVARAWGAANLRGVVELCDVLPPAERQVRAKIAAERTWLEAVGLVDDAGKRIEALSNALLEPVRVEWDDGVLRIQRDAIGLGEQRLRLEIARRLASAQVGVNDPATVLLGEDGNVARRLIDAGRVRALLETWQRSAEWRSASLARGRALARLGAPAAPALAAGPLGRAFLLAGGALEAGDLARVNRALTRLEEAPQSTEQVLHPAKFWGDAERDAPVVLERESELVAWLAEATGRPLAARRTLGELGCSLVLRGKDWRPTLGLADRPSAWLHRAATGWGGDRLFAFAAGPDAGPPVAVWITAWDSREELAEFVTAMTRRGGAVRVAERGRMAAVAFGDVRRGDLPMELDEVLSLVTMSKAGRLWDPFGT